MAFKKFILIFFVFIQFVTLYSENDKDMGNGLRSYSDKKYLDTIYYMNIVIEKDNELLTDALFWKAKSLYEVGLYNDSKVELENFFRTSSASTDYYEDSRFLYCKLFYKLKKYDDALLLLNQFLRNKTFKYYTQSAYFWLGETYLQLSNLNMAKETFQKFLELNPENKVVRNRISNIENVINILNKNKNISDEINYGEWFNEYLINKNKIVKSDKTELFTYLESIENKQDFFKWLDNNIDLIKEKKLDTPKKVDIIKEDSEKKRPEVEEVTKQELNSMEVEILSQIELELAKELESE